MQNLLRLLDFCFPVAFALMARDLNRIENQSRCPLKEQRAEKKTKPFPESEDSTVKRFGKSVQGRT
ncbi:MAG TPA: hypothetical protein VGY99_01295 [Candidatus Binataceae bacterium]|jgi:hypothetical protein|nr:hypothetical protein [Candidatus Binataceae bacterium]